jgi:hypothetical protein
MLSALANQNAVILMWVRRHHGITGNEKGDILARQGSAMPLLGPEPALGIPRCSAREAINWTERQHYVAWKDLPGHRHHKLFISRPHQRRTEDLKLSRHQLKMVVAIVMGRAPVRKHLHIIVLFDGDSTCRFYGLETETVQHIICCCKVLAREHYNFFGKLLAEQKI